MMNKFLKKTLIFSLSLIFGMCILDLFLTSNLKKSHKFQGEIEVWNDIYQGKINTDISIYGNSRAWTQINPSILKSILNQKVYNFGMDGHSFWLQYLRHVEYLKYNPKPKTILINVDIFTLEKRENLYLLEQFLPYMLWNKEIKKYTESFEGFTNTDYYIPFLRYTGKTKVFHNVFHNIYTKDSSYYRKSGFRSFNFKWGEHKGFINKIDDYFIKFDTKSIELFEDFIKECENLNIQLVLIYIPEHIEGQKKVKNRNKAVALYQEFAKKYELLFLNYSKDSMQLDKKYFYNSMHLNSTGANILSHKIANDLKKNIYLTTN